MKAQITQKQARDCVSIAFWYCQAYYLLKAYEPIYYTAWIYGRKSDIYNIDWIYISTWYWPVGEHLDYKLVDKYNKKAEKIWNNRDEKRETRKNKVNKLLNKLLKTKTQ